MFLIRWRCGHFLLGHIMGGGLRRSEKSTAVSSIVIPEGDATAGATIVVGSIFFVGLLRLEGMRIMDRWSTTCPPSKPKRTAITRVVTKRDTGSS